MVGKLVLHRVETSGDIEFFWEKRDRYMREDILSGDDDEWFLSEAYRQQIMALYGRDTDTLRIVFLLEDGQYAGFAVYVIYASEDGKGFILDFCVDAERRGRQVGRAFYRLLEQTMRDEGAVYFALNASNERNGRFWLSNGFQEHGLDEHGVILCRKDIR